MENIKKISQNTISYGNKIQEIIDTFNNEIYRRSSGQTKIKDISQYDKSCAIEVTTGILDVRNNIIGKSKILHETCTTVRSIPEGYSSTEISKYEYLSTTEINDLINDINLLFEQCDCDSEAILPCTLDLCNNCNHCNNCSCQSTCCNTVYTDCNHGKVCSADKQCQNCTADYCCDGDCAYSAGCSEGNACAECTVCGDGRCTVDYCRCEVTSCIHSTCTCDSNSCCNTYSYKCCNLDFYCCNTVSCSSNAYDAKVSMGCTAQCACNGNACSCNKDCSCNRVCSCNWV